MVGSATAKRGFIRLNLVCPAFTDAPSVTASTQPMTFIDPKQTDHWTSAGPFVLPSEGTSSFLPSSRRRSLSRDPRTRSSGSAGSKSLGGSQHATRAFIRREDNVEAGIAATATRTASIGRSTASASSSTDPRPLRARKFVTAASYSASVANSACDGYARASAVSRS